MIRDTKEGIEEKKEKNMGWSNHIIIEDWKMIYDKRYKRGYRRKEGEKYGME